MHAKFIPAYLLTFVNVLGFSLLLPVLPFVVEDYQGSDATYGLLLTAYSLFQFLAAPWLGRLSDSIGRKPVLLISQLGTLLSWVIFGSAWFVPHSESAIFGLPLFVIFLSRIFDGLTGGNASVTLAYVSDIADQNEKGWLFGMLGGVSGIALIVGPGVGGYLASTAWGFLAVALCGIGISFVTLVSIFVQLEESLAEQDRKPMATQGLLSAFRLFRRIQNLKASPTLVRIFVIRGLICVMMASYISTITLFMIDTFGFSERSLGLFMLVVGLFLAFNQAFVSKWFIKKTGELNTLRIGLCLATIGFFMITLTDHLWWYIPCYYVLNLGIALIMPTLNALIAQHADPQSMGEAMGINIALASLANALMPVLAASVYGVIAFTLYHLIALIPLMAFILVHKLQSTTATRHTPLD